MIIRSRSLRQCARGLIAGGVVAAGLILDPAGGLVVFAQEPPAKGAAPKEKAAPALSPGAQLRLQRLRTRKARAAYDIARLNREVAEIAVDEYREGIYSQDLATVEGEIKLAQSDLVRCEDRHEWARRMYRKGFVSKATLDSEQLSHEKARFTLEQAQGKKKVLEKYTREKTIRTLRAEAARAREVEIDREAEWEREATRQAEMELQHDRT